jgi:hypothetical protein
MQQRHMSHRVIAATVVVAATLVFVGLDARTHAAHARTAVGWTDIVEEPAEPGMVVPLNARACKKSVDSIYGPLWRVVLLVGFEPDSGLDPQDIYVRLWTGRLDADEASTIVDQAGPLNTWWAGEVMRLEVLASQLQSGTTSSATPDRGERVAVPVWDWVIFGWSGSATDGFAGPSSGHGWVAGRTDDPTGQKFPKTDMWKALATCPAGV